MNFVREEVLLDKGGFSQTENYELIHSQILRAITEIVWPTGSDKFTIHPKKTGNGVVPIKEAFRSYLLEIGWQKETRVDLSATQHRPGGIDVTKKIGDQYYAVEWETGNISSSHRAINKMLLGLDSGKLVGGTLIIPSRKFYQYLTDRVGNFEELAPYFPVWRKFPLQQGVLSVIVVEHDATSIQVPVISKGTDGRALR